MTYFALSNLVIIATNLPMAIFLFLNSQRKSAGERLAFLCIAAVVWGLGSFQYSTAKSADDAIRWWQVANVGSIFSTVFFYYFIVRFLNLHKPKLNFVINFFVCLSLFLNFFVPGTFIGEVRFVFEQMYYLYWPIDQFSVYLAYYIGFFFILLFYSFYLLVQNYLQAVMARKQQMKYLLLGMATGFIGCHACFVPVFGFDIYPYLNILIAFYTIPIGYAIAKYRFLDTSFVLTRGGIFLCVYTLVLGVPVWIGFRLLGSGVWLVPVLIMAIFATIGPFIYLFIQKRAEDALLTEQRQYQATLRQASLGMGQIKDLKRLLNLIVHVVTRAVKIENCKIFLRHEDSSRYVMKAMKGVSSGKGGYNYLDFDSPLVKYFKQMKEPLVYEEIKQRLYDSGGAGLHEIEQTLRRMGAALVVPSFIEQKLIAIISLGKKRSGKMYSHDDLAVFSILANQSALAIENAQFYEDMQRTHVQLLKAEKMATVGTMADGLSHQINNRLHAMGFIAGDLIDTIQFGKKKNGISDDSKEILNELEVGLNRIQENVKHGGEIVGGLLRYTRKGEQGFTAVEFGKLLDSAFEMAQFKIKVNLLEVERHFDGKLPDIKGNFTQLQEVFFNLIDNAYDAMMQRKEELAEEGYQPKLDIFARQVGQKMEILIQDNGMGVKESDMHKLFTPFFTTKATSEKGTGLGLYVIRQIIEDNHGGKVNFSSKYKIGSETQLILPLAVETLG